MEDPENKASPLGNPTMQDIQKDILFFKEEVLRDMRKLELQMKGQVEKNMTKLEKKVITNEAQSNDLSTKLNALTVIVNASSSKTEKIDKISALQTKLDEKLISAEVKLNSAVRDMSDCSFKLDRMYLNNLFIPGFIGEHCKYPNLKEYIQWLNTQISTFNTFKDKQQMDLKAYKTKLDGLIETFQGSVERVKGNFIEYCTQCVSDCEARFQQRIAVTEELIEQLRTENSTHALMLRNESKRLKVDWEKMGELKEEVLKQMRDEVEEFKAAGKKNIEGCLSFQREFTLIKSKFTELSEFIRDVRFRRGMEVKRTEYWEMSKKINFNPKKHLNVPNASPEETAKAEEEASILQTSNSNNTVFIKRREKTFGTEIIRHKIDFKEGKEEKESPIKKVKTIKFSEKNTNKLKNTMVKATENGKAKKILINRIHRVESENKLKTDKSFTDLNLTPNEDIKDLQPPHTPHANSKKDRPSFVKANQLLSSSPIHLNDVKDNFDVLSQRNQLQLFLSQQKELKLREPNEEDGRKQGPNSKGSYTNIIAENRTLTPHNHSSGHSIFTKNNSDKILSQSKEMTASEHQEHRHILKTVKRSSMTDEKVITTTITRRFSEIESRIGSVEQFSRKKLELIFLQLKKFIDQFNEDSQSSGGNIRYFHSGFFVPMSFDEKNILNYYPDRNPRVLSQFKSQMINKKTKEEFYFPQSKQPLNKVLCKTKGLSSSTTYSSLSVLMTNNPKSTPLNDPNAFLNAITPYTDKDKKQ